MIKINQIYCMDNVEGMKMIPDNFIDLTVTSPPYDNIRNYKGYSFDFKNVANGLFRVTKQGGVVVWVVKDATIKGNKTLSSFRQGIYFQEVGFSVYDIIIYSKKGGSLPHKNRYRDAYEFMFILSKEKPKTVNLIKDRINKFGGTESYGNVTVREQDGTLGKRKKRMIEKIGYRYNIWEYNTGRGHSSKELIAHKHPAIFPEKLAYDHIISWSNKEDIVLDPFMGSGTTAKMAKLLGRNFIGFETSQEYIDIAKLRLENIE